MRRMVASGLAPLVAIAVGCGSKALQTTGPTGAGGSWQIDAGTIDAPWDAPFAGRRSFMVQSQLQTDAGLPWHTFTLVLDADQRLAIVGANGTGSFAGVQQVADGTIRLDRAVVFEVTVPGACSASVRYDSFAFNLDSAGGLAGGAGGQLTTIVGDIAHSAPVTASLTGAADAVAPRLFLTTGGNDLTDPFTPFWVSSPEPLPVESYPALRAAGGDVVVLTPVPGDKYIVAFSKPGILLRYGETYTVDVDGIADFAGNRAVAGSGPTFTTRPPPPLVAADGFESVTDATLGGAEVISGAGAPTISGSRSLYIPPVTTFGAPGTTQLALRISIVPGNTLLRFSFRDVTLSPEATFGAQFRVGSVNASFVTMPWQANSGAGTSAVIDQTNVTLGPVTTMTINLPTDAAGEVVFARMTQGVGGCGGPLPLPPGIIIDDLHAE